MLINEAIQKSYFVIHLVYVWVKKNYNSKEDSKNYKFYYNCKSLIKVSPKLLYKIVFTI